MKSVIAICAKKVFSNETANEILPVIYRFTEAAHAEVRNLIQIMERISDESPSNHVNNEIKSEKLKNLEEKVNDVVEKWQNKIEKLGAEPKGMWIVDFDQGAGYFCWKYPESMIRFWHGYQDGFLDRKKFDSKTKDVAYESSNCTN